MIPVNASQDKQPNQARESALDPLFPIVASVEQDASTALFY